MNAKTIMNPKPVVLRAHDTVGTAANYILTHHLRHLPVVDEQGRYLGIFGIYALLRLTLPRAVTLEHGLTSVPFTTDSLLDLHQRLHELADESVVSCLRQDVEVVNPETPLMETVLILLRARMGLPVVEKTTGRLAGMISSWEALEKIFGEGI
jgi:CBS-domain-containing membrane protein